MIHATGPRRRTLLAIRLRQLGDVLATLGTLRALRNAAPGCRIVFVVDGHYHSLLRNVEYIDVLLPEPPKITGLYGAAAFDRYIDDLRKLDIDVALDFHSNTRSAVLSWLLAICVFLLINAITPSQPFIFERHLLFHSLGFHAFFADMSIKSNGDFSFLA